MLLRRSRSAPPSAAAKSVIGIDPSLTSTGWAVRTPTGVVSGRIDTGDLRGPWRLHYVRNQLAKLLDTHQPQVASYEDYAMGKAKGGNGRIFDIGELGGILKELLWSRGIDIILVPPTNLKMFVTGRGNPGFTPKGAKKLSDKQKKDFISAALLVDFGLDVQQNDEADAAGLLLLGETHTGSYILPPLALRSKRLDAVKSVSVVRGKLQLIAKSQS